MDRQGSLFGERDTLEEARQRLRRDIRNGPTCPCCSQLAKLYKRSIGGAQSRCLIWLVRSFEKEAKWYYHADFPMLQKRRGGGDYHKLRFWGLIEQQANEDNPRLPQTHSGMWRPTPKGCDFAHGRITVPKYALIFDNICYGFEGDAVNIRDCLPKYFDFWETWGFEG